MTRRWETIGILYGWGLEDLHVCRRTPNQPSDYIYISVKLDGVDIRSQCLNDRESLELHLKAHYPGYECTFGFSDIAFAASH